MEQMADVVIVSIYGRGNWLASELATRGWKVTLVDGSDRMGAWAPEDCEGPFGLLEAADLFPSQKTRLLEEGEARLVPHGFSVWLKDGPLEFKSELTGFLLEKNEVSAATERYLRHSGLPTRDSERERAALLKQPFESTWLAHFAHQMAATVMRENHCGLESGQALPLFAPFMVRNSSRAGWQKAIEAVSGSGVTVRTNANVTDIRVSQRLVDAIEVEDERSGVEKGRSFVWMLSGEESLRFNTPVHGTLFPSGAMGPDWYWTRYRVELRGRPYDGQLGAWTALLEDPYLPWTHTNFMIMRTLGDRAPSGQPRELDIWMRLPMWARFDFGYLADMQHGMEMILTRRLPQAQPVTKELPAEHRISRERLGPPRFPVYSKESHGRTEILHAPNLYFDGPEFWDSLDWLGQMRHQNELLKRLEAMKQVWDSDERRAELQAERRALKNQARDPRGLSGRSKNQDTDKDS